MKDFIGQALIVGAAVRVGPAGVGVAEGFDFFDIDFVVPAMGLRAADADGIEQTVLFDAVPFGAIGAGFTVIGVTTSPEAVFVGTVASIAVGVQLTSYVPRSREAALTDQAGVAVSVCATTFDTDAVSKIAADTAFTVGAHFTAVTDVTGAGERARPLRRYSALCLIHTDFG